MSKALFSNQQKIQLHFYRAHACFVKYFLMTKKLQQTKKLAYVTTCGPSGLEYGCISQSVAHQPSRASAKPAFSRSEMTDLKSTYCFCAHMHETMKYFLFTENV